MRADGMSLGLLPRKRARLRRGYRILRDRSALRASRLSFGSFEVFLGDGGLLRLLPFGDRRFSPLSFSRSLFGRLDRSAGHPSRDAREFLRFRFRSARVPSG